MKYIFFPALLLILIASCIKDEVEVNPVSIVGEYLGDYTKNITTNTTRINDENWEFHFKSDGRLIQFSDEKRFINGQFNTVRVSDTVNYALFGENQMRITGEDFEEIIYTIIKNDKTDLVMTYADEYRNHWEVGLKRK